jgi:glycosyltransferase involved in cell wall biosynthesis
MLTLPKRGARRSAATSGRGGLSQAGGLLRVGLVTTYPPSRGTLNEYGHHLARSLLADPRVRDVVVFGDELEGPSQELAPESRLTVRRCWRFDSFANGLRVARAVRREGVDALIFNAHFRSFGQRSAASALGLLAAPALSRLGVPTVLILHNIIEGVDLASNGFVKGALAERGARFAGTLLTRALLETDRVAVLLPTFAQTLTRKYGAGNVVHVPHGTLGEVYDEPKTLPPGPRRLLAFGKFGTYKKVEIMLDAVELLRRHGRGDIEAVVAGSDSPNTPGYLDSVKHRYAAMKGVTFLGYLPEEKVQETLSSAAVVVLPYTTTTGSSGVLHQVGQVGRAAVFPDIDDLAELTRAEGYVGETFEPEDAASLAAAAARILDDRTHRKRLERANLEAARACKGADTAARLLDALESVAPGA